jgi:hypothetical protein
MSNLTLLVIIGGFVYFIPTIGSSLRHHPQTLPIYAPPAFGLVSDRLDRSVYMVALHTGSNAAE